MLMNVSLQSFKIFKNFTFFSDILERNIAILTPSTLEGVHSEMRVVHRPQTE